VIIVGEVTQQKMTIINLPPHHLSELYDDERVHQPLETGPLNLEFFTERQTIEQLLLILHSGFQ